MWYEGPKKSYLKKKGVAIAQYWFLQYSILPEYRPTETDMNEYARLSANEWLKTKYGRSPHMGKAIAQTRVAASYGFLQTLYTTANDEGYPRNSETSRPEDIQLEEKNFRYGTDYLEDQLTDLLCEGGSSWDNSWSRGFEETWRLALNMYHGPKCGERRQLDKYGQICLERSILYPPLSK
jgi:hypothetical protein